MKPKNLKKKLVINKKTITNLSPEGMEQVKGGLPRTYSCYTQCIDDKICEELTFFETVVPNCNTYEFMCVSDSCSW